MNFEQILSQGKPNSSGRVQDVIDVVLQDKKHLPEVYDCLFSDDENVRLRAGDALEKICRAYPDWLKPYTDRLLSEVAKIEQHSVQWHLAQILGQIELDKQQTQTATSWLKARLSDPEVDWIVAGYSMETLAKYVRVRSVDVEQLIPLLKKQQKHHSKAVAKRAAKLLTEFTG